MTTPRIPVLASLSTTWAALLDLLYPLQCLGCGNRLDAEEAPLCHRCLHHLERPDPATLAALLARLPEAATALSDVFALWLFDTGGTVQRVQHRLKYGNRPRYGLVLGRMLGRTYRNESHPLPDLVLPVPLHRARLYERGYNQSAMLAEGVAQALDVPTATTLLHRNRATRSQTRLSRTRRWENVSGAFVVPEPEAVAGSRILLIDDVLTSGATLAAAATALHTAGATHVSAATLALARS